MQRNEAKYKKETNCLLLGRGKTQGAVVIAGRKRNIVPEPCRRKKAVGRCFIGKFYFCKNQPSKSPLKKSNSIDNSQSDSGITYLSFMIRRPSIFSFKC